MSEGRVEPPLPSIFSGWTLQDPMERYAEMDRIEALLENTLPTGDAPAVFKMDALLRNVWRFCDSRLKMQLMFSCRLCYLFDLAGAFADAESAPGAPSVQWSPSDDVVPGTPTEQWSPGDDVAPGSPTEDWPMGGVLVRLLTAPF